jgi:hypothetical protein
VVAILHGQATVASASMGAGGQVGAGLASELIHDVEDLDSAAGGGDVELVVQRPHVTRTPGVQPDGRSSGVAAALALTPYGGSASAFLPPQPLDLLAVHQVAFPAKNRVRAAWPGTLAWAGAATPTTPSVIIAAATTVNLRIGALVV